MASKIVKTLIKKSVDDLLIDGNLATGDYTIGQVFTSDRGLIIQVSTNTKKCNCPDCGHESTSVHTYKSKLIQILPLNGRPTFMELKTPQYTCKNKSCERKYFVDKMGLPTMSRKSPTLTQIVLAMAYFMSSCGTSMVLSQCGISISSDTVDDLIRRVAVEEVLSEEIGIDDVALRKGMKYITVIYDKKTHLPIAFLSDRDGKELKTWLEGHRNVALIARDRASEFAKVISEILPQCIQCADRFHLMQNLLHAIEEVFKDVLPRNIYIKNDKVIDIKEIYPKYEDLKISSIPSEDARVFFDGRTRDLHFSTDDIKKKRS